METLVCTVTLSVETKEYRVNTSIFMYALSIHPFWCKQNLVRLLGMCLSSSDGGSGLHLDQSSLQPRGAITPKTL